MGNIVIAQQLRDGFKDIVDAIGESVQYDEQNVVDGEIMTTSYRFDGLVASFLNKDIDGELIRSTDKKLSYVINTEIPTLKVNSIVKTGDIDGNGDNGDDSRARRAVNPFVDTFRIVAVNVRTIAGQKTIGTATLRR